MYRSLLTEIMYRLATKLHFFLIELWVTAGKLKCPKKFFIISRFPFVISNPSWHFTICTFFKEKKTPVFITVTGFYSHRLAQREGKYEEKTLQFTFDFEHFFGCIFLFIFISLL